MILFIYLISDLSWSRWFFSSECLPRFLSLTCFCLWSTVYC